MRLMIWILAFLPVMTPKKILAQIPLREGWYKATLQRSDEGNVVFNFWLKNENGKPVMYIRNAGERLKVDELRRVGDSLWVRMPFFESDMRLRLLPNGNWQGSWTRAVSAGDETMPMTAVWNDSSRLVSYTPPTANISGKWSVTIIRPNGTPRPAIGIFRQEGNYVEGTFLTPSGDYRFLEGCVSGDTLKLSCFDGSHAYLFTALVGANEMRQGKFYNGKNGFEAWTAQRNQHAALPDTTPVAKMKPGFKQLDFRFKDLDGQTVSLSDARFRSKVVLVQIMGSWCPNCMDETAFLSQFYNEYHTRGVEVVSLAIELTTDEERARSSIMKFRNRFNVNYPMLITGVAVSDEKRTEKTLPQLTEIRAFPTLIFVDKKGDVREIHQGFYGPGAPAEFASFKNYFYRTVLGLLSE